MNDRTVTTATANFLLLDASTSDMSEANTNIDDSVSTEIEDDFQYEEVSSEDDWSLTEGEEDLEATVRAIKNRAEASAAAAAVTEPVSTPISRQPESVEHFLCNFLVEMGMTDTLDCFQSEWSEMVQKGLLDKEQVGVVPDVYTENLRLHGELKNAQREEEEYRLAAAAAAETLLTVQKSRDFHRRKHNRIVQERNRLIEEMRKLQMQCDSRKPELQQMNQKYRAVLKQTLQMTLEGDKAVEGANRRSTQPVHPES